MNGITNTWFHVENTGWTNGKSWFKSGPSQPTLSYNPNSFKTFDDAAAYAGRCRASNPDPAILYRVVQTDITREPNRTTTVETFFLLEEV